MLYEEPAKPASGWQSSVGLGWRRRCRSRRNDSRCSAKKLLKHIEKTVPAVVGNSTVWRSAWSSWSWHSKTRPRIWWVTAFLLREVLGRRICSKPSVQGWTQLWTRLSNPWRRNAWSCVGSAGHDSSTHSASRHWCLWSSSSWPALGDLKRMSGLARVPTTEGCLGLWPVASWASRVSYRTWPMRCSQHLSKSKSKSRRQRRTPLRWTSTHHLLRRPHRGRHQWMLRLKWPTPRLCPRKSQQQVTVSLPRRTLEGTLEWTRKQSPRPT
mmetsp:Transcript_75003/g.243772  ORF Transcript_75003/g.243772 Transcript_75003/m.243772 type:complete len:268 (+) Transcript_75003:3810-4613(+)